MPAATEKVHIVLSESSFACIENAVARKSPVRNAVEQASRHGRQAGEVNAPNKVVIACSEAEAQELLRLAQVSCITAAPAIKTALMDARQPAG
jgi:hypothetical protein